MKRTLLTTIVLSFLLIPNVGRAQTQTNSIRLDWSYSPPDDPTNYVFLLRSTNDVSAPLPWPVIGQTTGSLTLTASVAVTNYETRFFYVAVQDRRSSSTNYIAESPPSNIVTSRVIPGVTNTTISRGK